MFKTFVCNNLINLDFANKHSSNIRYNGYQYSKNQLYITFKYLYNTIIWLIIVQYNSIDYTIALKMWQGNCVIKTPNSIMKIWIRNINKYIISFYLHFILFLNQVLGIQRLYFQLRNMFEI